MDKSISSASPHPSHCKPGMQGGENKLGPVPHGLFQRLSSVLASRVTPRSMRSIVWLDFFLLDVNSWMHAVSHRAWIRLMGGKGCDLRAATLSQETKLRD
jgi:hypothetical protein